MNIGLGDKYLKHPKKCDIIICIIVSKDCKDNLRNTIIAALARRFSYKLVILKQRVVCDLMQLVVS